MCMSVPQIAVFAISMSTSLGPTWGSGISSSQMPGFACCLTRAFMRLSVKDPELAAYAGEGVQSRLELRACQARGHLRADARLALRHHRVGEADHVHPAREQRVGHARGERRIAEHHRDDRMLAGFQVEARGGESGAEEARVIEELRSQLRAVLEQIEHR